MKVRVAIATPAGSTGQCYAGRRNTIRMFEYTEFRPPPALAPYVKCYWSLRGAVDDLPQEERILPDGSVELIFHFGEPFTGNGERQAEAVLVGEIRRPTLLRPSRHADVMGVRFRVGAAAVFLGMPVREIRDLILPAQDLLPCDEVLDARTAQGRINGLERLLLRRLSVPKRFDTARAAISVIDSAQHPLRIREVAAAAGCTERTLERAFEDCVGMTAKSYLRLMRFRSWLTEPQMDWGYFDDSHLVHEFRAFAGTTPAAFLAERHAMNDAFAGTEVGHSERNEHD